MGRGILTDLAIKLSADAAQLKTGLNNVNSKLNKVDKGLGTISRIMPIAFGAGTVTAWANAAARASLELLEIKDNVGRFVKDAANIDVVTGKLKAMSQVFNVDINKALEASNVLVNQWGTTWARSLELIEQGLALSGAKREEFLEQIREYSPQFKEAKADAEDLFGVILKGFEGGVWNDKAPDAIKEGTLALREMTTATSEALRALGFDSAEISRNISNGTLSIWEALKQVSKRMAELPPDSRAVGLAMADIFKGAGEDAGYKFLTSFKDGFSIKKAIAGNELAQAKLQLQKEATNIATIWSAALGKNSAWWQQFKADVLGIGPDLVAGIARAIGAYDIAGNIPVLELISQAGTKEGIEKSLNLLQKKITETRRELKAGGPTFSFLGFAFGGNDEEEQAALNKKLDGYIARYKAFKKQLAELQTGGAPDGGPKNDGTGAASFIKPLIEATEDDISNADFDALLQKFNTTYKGYWERNIDEINASLPALDLPKLEGVEGWMSTWEELNTKMQSTQQIAGSLRGMFDSLGAGIETLANKEANAAQKIGATAAAISGVISQYLALMAAKAAAGDAGKGFPLNVAFTAAAIAGLMGIISPFIKQRAVGGSTSGLTLVGERGPELFDGSGYVYNSHRTKQMLGGGSGGTVVFRIHRDELVGIMQSYYKELEEFG